LWFLLIVLVSAFKNDEIYSQLPYDFYWSNIDTAIADDIYNKLLGKKLYSQMAREYGQSGELTFE
jgi:iron complex transport system substrate-binding protein